MPDGTAASASPTETIHVNDRTVACDGWDDVLGHPRVFLHIEDTPAPGHSTRGSVVCPYCSRLYVLNEGAGHDTGH